MPQQSYKVRLQPRYITNAKTNTKTYSNTHTKADKCANPSTNANTIAAYAHTMPRHKL